MDSSLVVLQNRAVATRSGPLVPALVARSGRNATLRFLDFFATQIENENTRAAYLRAAREFLAWCDGQKLGLLADIQPVHVAAWLKQSKLTHAVPTVKLRLAAIRHLFDWLVTGHVMQTNPALSVRGPKHVVRKGKTPVLDAAEVRTLLDSIGKTAASGCGCTKRAASCMTCRATTTPKRSFTPI
jgi:site-specific recombinase XerD